jgi:hypothetical protein
MQKFINNNLKKLPAEYIQTTPAKKDIITETFAPETKIEQVIPEETQKVIKNEIDN